jgi:hypothetical protein
MSNYIPVDSSKVVGKLTAEVSYHLFHLRMKAPMLYQMLADIDYGSQNAGEGIEAATDVIGVGAGKGADLLYWSSAVKTNVEALSLQDCTKVYQGEIV